MDFHSMKRKELQALCKKHSVPANLTNLEMANKLSLLLKEKENPETRWQSCLKDSGKISDEEDCKDVTRKLKKVRFSPENEMIVYERDIERENTAVLTRAARRKPILKPESNNRGVVIEDVINTEPLSDITGNPRRTSRSRAQKSKEDKVDEKNVDCTDKPPPVVELGKLVEEVGCSTRRQLRNRVLVSEKPTESKDGGVVASNKNPRQKGSRKRMNMEGSDTVLSSEVITESKMLAEAGKYLELGKVPRRSKRNVVGAEDTILRSAQLSKEMIEGPPSAANSSNGVEVQKERETVKKKVPLLKGEANITDMPLRRSKRNASGRDSKSTSTEKDGVAHATRKNMPRERGQKPTLEEETAVTEDESVINNPPRRSARNASRRDLVAPAGLTCNSVGKEKQHSRSRMPVGGEEAPFTESISVVEEPKITDANLSVPQAAGKKVPENSKKRKKGSKGKSLANKKHSSLEPRPAVAEMVVLNEFTTVGMEETSAPNSKKLNRVGKKRENISMGQHEETSVGDDIHKGDEDNQACQSLHIRGDLIPNNLGTSELEGHQHKLSNVLLAEITSPAADDFSLVQQSDHAGGSAGVLNSGKKMETEGYPSAEQNSTRVGILGNQAAENDATSVYKEQNSKELEEPNGFAEPIVHDLFLEDNVGESGGTGDANFENAAEEVKEICDLDILDEKGATPSVPREKNSNKVDIVASKICEIVSVSQEIVPEIVEGEVAEAQSIIGHCSAGTTSLRPIIAVECRDGNQPEVQFVSRTEGAMYSEESAEEVMTAEDHDHGKIICEAFKGNPSVGVSFLPVLNKLNNQVSNIKEASDNINEAYYCETPCKNVNREQDEYHLRELFTTTANCTNSIEKDDTFNHKTEMIGGAACDGTAMVGNVGAGGVNGQESDNSSAEARKKTSNNVNEAHYCDTPSKNDSEQDEYHLRELFTTTANCTNSIEKNDAFNHKIEMMGGAVCDGTAMGGNVGAGGVSGQESDNSSADARKKTSDNVNEVHYCETSSKNDESEREEYHLRELFTTPANCTNSIEKNDAFNHKTEMTGGVVCDGTIIGGNVGAGGVSGQESDNSSADARKKTSDNVNEAHYCETPSKNEASEQEEYHLRELFSTPANCTNSIEKNDAFNHKTEMTGGVVCDGTTIGGNVGAGGVSGQESDNSSADARKKTSDNVNEAHYCETPSKNDDSEQEEYHLRELFTTPANCTSPIEKYDTFDHKTEMMEEAVYDGTAKVGKVGAEGFSLQKYEEEAERKKSETEQIVHTKSVSPGVHKDITDEALQGSFNVGISEAVDCFLSDLKGFASKDGLVAEDEASGRLKTKSFKAFEEDGGIDMLNFSVGAEIFPIILNQGDNDEPERSEDGDEKLKLSTDVHELANTPEDATKFEHDVTCQCSGVTTLLTPIRPQGGNQFNIQFTEPVINSDSVERVDVSLDETENLCLDEYTCSGVDVLEKGKAASAQNQLDSDYQIDVPEEIKMEGLPSSVLEEIPDGRGGKSENMDNFEAASVQKQHDCENQMDVAEEMKMEALPPSVLDEFPDGRGGKNEDVEDIFKAASVQKQHDCDYQMDVAKEEMKMESLPPSVLDEFPDGRGGKNENAEGTFKATRVQKQHDCDYQMDVAKEEMKIESLPPSVLDEFPDGRDGNGGSAEDSFKAGSMQKQLECDYQTGVTKEEMKMESLPKSVLDEFPGRRVCTSENVYTFKEVLVQSIIGNFSAEKSEKVNITPDSSDGTDPEELMELRSSEPVPEKFDNEMKIEERNCCVNTFENVFHSEINTADDKVDGKEIQQEANIEHGDHDINEENVEFFTEVELSGHRSQDVCEENNSNADSVSATFIRKSGVSEVKTGVEMLKSAAKSIKRIDMPLEENGGKMLPAGLVEFEQVVLDLGDEFARMNASDLVTSSKTKFGGNLEKLSVETEKSDFPILVNLENRNGEDFSEEVKRGTLPQLGEIMSVDCVDHSEEAQELGKCKLIASDKIISDDGIAVDKKNIRTTAAETKFEDNSSYEVAADGSSLQEDFDNHLDEEEVGKVLDSDHVDCMSEDSGVAVHRAHVMMDTKGMDTLLPIVCPNDGAQEGLDNESVEMDAGALGTSDAVESANGEDMEAVSDEVAGTMLKQDDLKFGDLCNHDDATIVVTLDEEVASGGGYGGVGSVQQLPKFLHRYNSDGEEDGSYVYREDNNGERDICTQDLKEIVDFDNSNDVSSSRPDIGAGCSTVPSVDTSANHWDGTLEFNSESQMFPGGNEGDETEKSNVGAHTSFSCDDGEEARAIKENGNMIEDAEEQLGAPANFSLEEFRRLVETLPSVSDENIPIDRETLKEQKDGVDAIKKHAVENLSVSTQKTISEEEALVMNGGRYAATDESFAASMDAHEVENKTNKISEHIKHLEEPDNNEGIGEATDVNKVVSDPTWSIADRSPESTVDRGITAGDAQMIEHNLKTPETENQDERMGYSRFSARKSKNTRSNLIQGAAKRSSLKTLDMKENATIIKSEHTGNVSAVKTAAKRRALEELQKN